MLGDMPNGLRFRVPQELQGRILEFLREYRMATGENMTVSDLCRFCVDHGLRHRRAELLGGGAR
jgi:hypothetical protein